MNVIKNVSKLFFVFIIIAGFSVSTFADTPTASDKKTKTVEGTRGYRDEINRPVEPWTGPPRTGEQVYAFVCASCHARTTQGAPLPDDEAQWNIRARQGMDVLLQHTIDGYRQGLMPARGGCENCSDAEVKAAIVYILAQSGITLEDKPVVKK